jgi:maleylpyruvate isomerase
MPVVGVAPVKKSHARLRPTLTRFVETGTDPRRPSRLPGWTVGHVLTHLARNADSHVRMLDAARRGEVADQYAGGNPQRSADIEAGAGRPAADLVADVLTSAARLEESWDATRAEVWATGHGRVVSGVWPLAELPFRRWREVELHHVDLGLDYDVSDWPDAYVDVELATSVAGLARRLAPGEGLELRATDSDERWLVPEGVETGRTLTGPRRALLAWLVGRGGDAGFPVVAPWAG